MSWLDLLKEALQYGPSIIVLFLVVIFIRPIYKWMKSIEKRLDEKAKRLHDLEVSMNTVHDTCHIPEGAIVKIKENIRSLQVNEHAVGLELKGMSIKLSNVEAMTAEIYSHFFKEGINRRSSDE